MDRKNSIRKQYQKKRREKYFEISKDFFNPLISLTKKIKKSEKIFISLYYPSLFELNILKIFDVEYFKKFNFLLPIIEKKGSMNFYKWKKKDILFVNDQGILEPLKSKIIIPKIMLVPLLAYDNKKNRLGFGKGFYDRYLYNNFKKDIKIITVGVAFSFQKHHNLPVNKNDFRLDYIITEKGIIE